ncbi:hypothetical protein P3X46_006437 [Hevea brasiliensis]|uniref:Uncharacterized protein n=1 Tax=Hevea brasiliensis TaxID=3981 RepID=A0ABQ9MSK8_HEVBR|nr:hypothetical protein P3X46_006437 [Hevea brasiliensis]
MVVEDQDDIPVEVQKVTIHPQLGLEEKYKDQFSAEMEQDFIVDMSSIGEIYEDGDDGQLESAMGKIGAESDVIAQFINKTELFDAELLGNVFEKKKHKGVSKSVAVGSKWQYLGSKDGEFSFLLLSVSWKINGKYQEGKGRKLSHQMVL